MWWHPCTAANRPPAASKSETRRMVSFPFFHGRSSDPVGGGWGGPRPWGSHPPDNAASFRYIRTGGAAGLTTLRGKRSCAEVRGGKGREVFGIAAERLAHGRHSLGRRPGHPPPAA